MMPSEKGERARRDLEGFDKLAWLFGMTTICRAAAHSRVTTRCQSAKFYEKAKDFENQLIRLMDEI